MIVLHETRQLNETSSFEFNGTESDATCDFCNFTIDSSQRLDEDLREEQNKQEEIRRTEEALIYVIIVVTVYLAVLLFAVGLSLRQQIQRLWFTFGSYERCDYSILEQYEDESKDLKALPTSSKNFVYFDSRIRGHISNI